MKKKNQKVSKKAILVVAIVVSIILYLAGVFSGLQASNLIKKETQESVDSLTEYVDILDKNLKSMQLEQIFIETLDHEDMCRFSSISMNRLVDELRIYWSQLPFRIEAYEQYADLSDDYLTVKDSYTQLSVRTWIIAKSKYEKCDTDLMPVLYFYATDCPNCIAQGEELDKLQTQIINSGREVLVFTVDLSSDELIIKNIADYYNISSAPTIIIDEEVFQGKLFTAQNLLEAVA